jgi:hypothetical protein
MIRSWTIAAPGCSPELRVERYFRGLCQKSFATFGGRIFF